MISYVIGYRKENGSIAEVIFHNKTIFHGSEKEAKEMLKFFKEVINRDGNIEKHKYEIFKLV